MDDSATTSAAPITAATITATATPAISAPKKRTFQDLLDLLLGPATISIPCGESAESATRPNEDVDDPHRLAVLNLSRYSEEYAGRTIKLWRDAWYVWKHGCYHRISKGELSAKITRAVKAEFDHQNIIDQLAAEDPDKIKTRKVTVQLVSHVVQATASLIHDGTGPVCLPYEIEPNTWLPTRSLPSRGRERYISLQNGLLDLDAVLADRPESECILPPSPNWFSMVVLDYGFSMAAECPKFMDFLNFNLEGDPERIAVARQWAGYLLTPSTDEQKFMILEGEGGNGKSVYIAVLTAMLGPANVSNVALENFGDRFQRTDTIGKLLNACGDCGEIDKAAEGLLKSFISGDRMFFDRKGVEGMNCPPTARLMLACNNRPRFNDRSDGIWRRMLVMPWNVKVPEDRRIKGMDKIQWWQDSGELPGIFKWAIQGLAELTEHGGFTRSSEMDKVVAAYKTEMNPARAFLTEECQSGTDEHLHPFCRCKELYQKYIQWCKEKGHHHPMSDMMFGKEVRRTFKNVVRRRERRDHREWYYEGIHDIPPKPTEDEESTESQNPTTRPIEIQREF